MTLQVLSGGIGCFFLFFICHLLVWRLFSPRKAIFLLLLIFLFMPWTFFLLTGFLQSTDSASLWALTLIHTALALVYITSYPSLTQNIPTFLILLVLKDAPHGLNEKEIFSRIQPDDDLFSAKVEELAEDALIHNQDGVLTLKPAGKVFAVFFTFYRRLLKLETGAG